MSFCQQKACFQGQQLALFVCLEGTGNNFSKRQSPPKNYQKTKTSWWLNQPPLKNSQNGNLPQMVKINHHPKKPRSGHRSFRRVRNWTQVVLSVLPHRRQFFSPPKNSETKQIPSGRQPHFYRVGLITVITYWFSAIYKGSQFDSFIPLMIVTIGSGRLLCKECWFQSPV